MSKVSRADNRSISQVSFFLSSALAEARQGNELKAGRYLGMAEMGAAVIDSTHVRDRAELLLGVLSSEVAHVARAAFRERACF